MRKITSLLLLTGIALLAACNTVHGAGQDAASVGRVFSKHPDGKTQTQNR